ncbi:MAG TPA: DNA repair protein RecN [Clostridia bacterium]|nr:DNA repair protein RecN [Clostridia bacterium]
MLLELSIKNYVIIEQQVITLEPGLNIITGETGTGKSLVIDALSAITGGRFSKEDIRTGEAKASIEALFSLEGIEYLAGILEEYGIDIEEDKSLVITREVNLQGKSVCRINGQIVTLSMLKKIAQFLVDIVGQNEHQILFNTVKHGEFVDDFGSNGVLLIKEEIKKLIDKLGSLKLRLDSISGNAAERERKLDLLKFQIDEISNADLKPNEDEELKIRRNLLINAEKLLKGIAHVYHSLFKGEGGARGAADLLNDSISSLEELTGIDEKIEVFKTSLEGMIYQLEDIKGSLRSYRDSIEFSDSEIDLLEERLDQINKLKRKYGSSIDEVLAYRDRSSQEFENLVNSEKIASGIEKEIAAVTEEYVQKAGLLSDKRKDLAHKLEKLIEKELQELNMFGSRFYIRIAKDESLISINGFDKIEFLLSPNPGEPEKSLSKIASGGEMSRVMLAIKNAFSEIEKAPCVVFDEVDTGVGGQTANMVGQKIKAISKNTQILCITHLPQIASLSDNHILVDKIVRDNKTYTKIKILDYSEKIKEIARMLGGNENIEASIEHAKKLVGKV